MLPVLARSVVYFDVYLRLYTSIGLAKSIVFDASILSYYFLFVSPLFYIYDVNVIDAFFVPKFCKIAYFFVFFYG